MQGERGSVVGADGTRIGLLTHGEGPPLLLVHGGMCGLDRWAPLWPALTARYRVTAMDRRGRGSSGDGAGYRIEAEYDDVSAVAEWLRRQTGGPVDAFGHSYGAVCVLGAAARGAPVRRVVLYEPPGPPTVDPGWLERAEALIAAGDPGRAMASFLVDVVGYTWDEVFAMRDAPAAREASEIVERTMVREGHALTAVDLAPLADAVPQPVLLLLGADSPPWAPALTRALHRRLPRATLVVLADQGHEAVDRAPAELARALDDFLAGP